MAFRRRPTPTPGLTRDPGWIREHLPLPPMQMCELVGVAEPDAFEQVTGNPVFEVAEPRQYESVLDLGRGCGRLARRLALAAAPMPSRYLGVDLPRGMIRWDRENLAPLLPGFRFEHHDVYNHWLNPGARKPRMAALPSVTTRSRC